MQFNKLSCVKMLERTEVLMTLSSATFTIKDKSQEKKELIFNVVGDEMN